MVGFSRKPWSELPKGSKNVIQNVAKLYLYIILYYIIYIIFAFCSAKKRLRIEDLDRFGTLFKRSIETVPRRDVENYMVLVLRRLGPLIYAVEVIYRLSLIPLTVCLLSFVGYSNRIQQCHVTSPPLRKCFTFDAQNPLFSSRHWKHLDSSFMTPKAALSHPLVDGFNCRARTPPALYHGFQHLRVQSDPQGASGVLSIAGSRCCPKIFDKIPGWPLSQGISVPKTLKNMASAYRSRCISDLCGQKCCWENKEMRWLLPGVAVTPSSWFYGHIWLGHEWAEAVGNYGT